MNNSFPYRLVLAVGLLAALCLLETGCQPQQASRPQDDSKEKEAVVEQIVDSEELLLALNTELAALKKSAMNLTIPDPLGRELFANQVEFSPWDFSTASPGKPREVGRDQLTIWPSELEKVAFFDHAKFYMIRGHFDENNSNRYQSDVGFYGLARTEDRKWLAAKALCKVGWVRNGDSGDSWQIANWKTTDFSANQSDQLMFRDTLEGLVEDPTLAKLLRTSQHMEFAEQIFQSGDLRLTGFESLAENFKEPNLEQYFRIQQAGQHPGVAIVDFDNDGWDDLYLCDEWRPNRLLKNINGKKLVDVAAEVGLDLGPTTSAIFADFDNDGDQDALVGCFFQPCKLMFNEEGKYVDRTAEYVSVDLPKLTTSISAADYNNDGLLDIYISTYGFPAGRKSSRSRYWTVDLLNRSEAIEMQLNQEGTHRILNALGPPNLLLMNTGNGGFRRAPENDDVQLHHNTFQSTWCDYDLDGDPDLYVCNDFAPDFLLRNDGPDGFTDVTLEAGGEDMLGFGMGACWGDYDLDGDFDLYVSNMYSKAGKRITKQIDGLDERFFRMATGNRLFANEQGKFKLVVDKSGEGSAAGKAGWSWGGQFGDFNNDGRQDLYVCSGFFTAPEKYASTVDL